MSRREVPLKIKAVIGFNGKVVNSLHYTPCGKYIVYPLGSFVVLKNVRTDKESFLEGHTRDISCVAVSHDGTKCASGQNNITGVKADVVVWDLTAAKAKLEAGEVMLGDSVLIHRLRQHLGRVQDVSFSCHDDFLASMGGQDDNAIVVWSLEHGSAVCGGSAGMDSGMTLKWCVGGALLFCIFCPSLSFLFLCILALSLSLAALSPSQLFCLASLGINRVNLNLAFTPPTA